MIEGKEILLDLGNVKILRHDVLNVVVAVLEEKKEVSSIGSIGITITKRWRTKGFHSNVKLALHNIVARGYLMDEYQKEVVHATLQKIVILESDIQKLIKSLEVDK